MFDGMYFQVYKKIENEVITLSEWVSLVDDHRSVYSQNIADLIIRCNVEIESIAKELYRKEHNGDCGSPGECIIWLNKQFALDQKMVHVISPNFYFDIDDIMHFCPFNYINESEEDYYCAYNAIKHDRKKNMEKASIYVLIRILGALFILNVLYKNVRIDLGQDDKYGTNIDKTGGSDVFSFDVAPCHDSVLLDEDEHINEEQCLYRIVREDMEYCLQIKYINTVDDYDTLTLLLANKWFQDKVKTLISEEIDEITLEKEFLNELEMSRMDFYDRQKIKKIDSIKAGKIASRYWAELNGLD